MSLATSSIAFQMNHEAQLRRIEFEREAQRARDAAFAAQEKLPQGIEDLTPGSPSNERSGPRLRNMILRRTPGTSAA
jgi:hypothetical protein